MHHGNLKGYSLIRLSGIALFAIGMASSVIPYVEAAPADVPEERVGGAPLSETEIARVRKAAQGQVGVSAITPGTQPPQEVMIELRQEPKEQSGTQVPRRADVYTYDYSKDVTIRTTVDVRTGKIEKSEPLEGVQPLISPAEAQQALNIALNDPVAGKLLREQYKQQTGTELAKLEQLQVHAGVFSSDTKPTITEVKECGKRRCVELLLSSQQGHALNVIPIVNLSSKKVLYISK